jgi:hypothetical protein
MFCALSRAPHAGEGGRIGELLNMRKGILFLLFLTFVLRPQLAFADPLRITSGAFLLDIEGDMFAFTGGDFSLKTTTIGNYATKEFPGRCEPTGWPPGFCAADPRRSCCSVQASPARYCEKVESASRLSRETRRPPPAFRSSTTFRNVHE